MKKQPYERAIDRIADVFTTVRRALYVESFGAHLYFNRALPVTDGRVGVPYVGMVKDAETGSIDA
jgi:hypothetical protein